ncbi:MAG: S8 family serine peptidase [Bacteroidales bacterium]|nr:S8 family serine peptidase [Bacteroidales bacterium]
MKQFITLLTTISIVLFSLSLSAQTINPEYQDGRIYFKVKNQMRNQVIMPSKDRKISIYDNAFLKKIDEDFGLEWVEKAFLLKTADEDLKSIYRVKIDDASKVDQAIEALEDLNFVEYAEKVPMRKTLHTPNDPLYASTAYGYNWNWHLDIINAQQAWDISTGNSNIKVAIVDNAIWSSHPDLSNKIVAQQSYVAPTNSSSPPSTVSQTSSMDAYEWSHGTHCAGLVGAQSNNNIGVASIGYNVSLMTYRSADNNGDMYYTGYGEEWAANNGANVISMSYGGGSYSSSENTWYNNLKSSGIVLVAAAGNDGVSTLSYPAAYAAVIAVASVNEDLELSDFSQYGSWVDIAAPGGYALPTANGANLPSTTYTQAYYLDGITGFTGANYDGMQGTSMACPVTAGLCGLLLSINPALTPDEVESCLKTTAQATTGNSIEAGSGCIDAYAAAQCAQGSASLDAEFSANTTTITMGQSVTFTDLSTDGGTAISSWSWTFEGGSQASFNGQNPPAITYNTAGDFDVTLTVNNGTSDTETKTEYIHVLDASTAECDTIDYIGTETIVLYGVSATSGGGYVCGTNGYGDMKKANFYSYSPTNNILEGAYFYFAVAESGTNPNVSFEVLNGSSGTPGSALHTVTVPLADIESATASTPIYYVDFGGLQLSDDFFISYSCGFNMGSGDTLSSVSTQNDLATNYAWEQWDGGSWYEFSDANAWEMSTALGIFPVLCPLGQNTESPFVDNAIQIYPNPSNGTFNIQIEKNSKATNISIYNMSGAEVFNATQTESTKKYNLSNLPAGVYVAKISNQSNTVTRKIVIE